MQQGCGKIYYFGEYRLCPQTRELTRKGEEVYVQDKIFRLLTYLIENHDRAVTKEELLDSVWEGKPLSETVLARSVMKARRATGDDYESQHCIRTIRTFGYRFIADVTVEPVASDLSEHESNGYVGTNDQDDAPGPLEEELLSRSSDPPKPGKWLVYPALVILVLVAGVISDLIIRYTNTESTPVSNRVDTAAMETAAVPQPVQTVGLALLPVQTIPKEIDLLGLRVTMLLERALSDVPWLEVTALPSKDELDDNKHEYFLLSTVLIQTSTNYQMTYTLEAPGSAKTMGKIYGSNPFAITEEVINVISKITHQDYTM